MSLPLRVVTVLALAGCSGGPGAGGPRVADTAGLSLTYYVDGKAADATGSRLVVVEQRRWVEVDADHSLEIDRIDDGADLESLVIEPLGARGALTLGRCARDSVVTAMRGSAAGWVGRKVEITVADGRTVAGTITAVADRNVVLAGDGGRSIVVAFDGWRAFRLAGGDSVVRCQVTAGGGRRLVRVVYATTALGFAAEHTVRAVLDDADRGTVDILPRFTVETPAWQVVADVALFDGLPGGTRPPREVFRGPITLTGDPVVVAGPTRSAPARIEAVYRYSVPAGYEGGSPRDPSWHGDRTTSDVWNWLEMDLGEDALPPGQVELELSRHREPVQLSLVPQDAIEIPESGGGIVRLRLEVAPDLKCPRYKTSLSYRSDEIVESLLFSVTNYGERPREIVIEEELRPSRRRVTVLRPFPRKPTVRNGMLRVRLTVPPDRPVRVGYVLEYDL